MRRLRHGMLTLALHELRSGGGPSLLLLHALGGSAEDWADEVERWPGAVFALDFAGHGSSQWRPGGAYTPELFAADADVALAAIGGAALAGAGLGAYVALLLAGSRPALVPAALLFPGPGLAGGGPRPDCSRPAALVGRLEAIEARRANGRASADPMLEASADDARPPEYAAAFAGAARRLLLAEDDGPRPPWWERLRALPGAQRASVDRRRGVGELWTVVRG